MFLKQPFFFFFFLNFLNGKKLLRQCQHDSGCLFSGHLVMPLSEEEELWQPGSLLLLCPELHCHPGEESATNAASVCVRVCVSVRVCKGLVFLHACTKLFFFGGGGKLPRKQSLLCSKFIWAIHVCWGSAQKLQAERKLRCLTEILRGKRGFSAGGRRRKRALSGAWGCSGRWCWRGK